MTITDDITTQRQKHGKVSYLLHKLQEQRTEALKAETSLAHDIAMHVQGLTGSLDALAKIMDTQFGGAMIERECLTLGGTKSLLVRLAVTAWKKSEQQ